MTPEQPPRAQLCADERDLMLRELQHKCRNMLQVIGNSFAAAAKKSKDPEVRAALSGAQQRIQVMSELYAMLYCQHDGQSVHFQGYLKDICHHLGRALEVEPHSLVFAIDGDDPVWPQPFARTLGMLASEIVMNAIKHAFPRGGAGVIRLGLELGADICRLEICDDGIGFDKDRVTDGDGARLIARFSRAISGTVKSVSAPGEGTRVTILFPPPAMDGPG